MTHRHRSLTVMVREGAPSTSLQTPGKEVDAGPAPAMTVRQTRRYLIVFQSTPDSNEAAA